MPRKRRDDIDALLQPYKNRADVLRAARADRKRHPHDWATPQAAERTLALVVVVVDEVAGLAAAMPFLEADEVPTMQPLVRRSVPVRW